jgi:surfeit locus 1 family protein
VISRITPSSFFNKKVRGWLPYVIGAILVTQFLALGVWQIDRGLQKRTTQHAFDSKNDFATWSVGMPFRSFQKLAVTGDFDSEHQILLENIILNNRYGYYVLTPLMLADDLPVLLVNRGWIERAGRAFDATRIKIDTTQLTVRGRAGSLPKIGYRMSEAVTSQSSWPLGAIYPTLDELSHALGRDVLPFVLLLDPYDSHGFFRHWVPEEMGPGKHFAYALQWFAMGMVLAAVLVWNYRKRGLET